MSEEVKISRGGLILYGIAFLIVAFIGVLAGNWFIGYRQAQKYERQIQSLRQYSSALIEAGDKFPALELIDLNGNPANILSLLEGHRTLIITLSPGCKPCALTLDEWKKQINEIPADLKIIGIADSGPGEALAYTDDTGFPFDIYCDTAHVLPDIYGLEAFPTVVGVDEFGLVLFIREGWLDKFTIHDAYGMIKKGK